MSPRFSSSPPEHQRRTTYKNDNKKRKGSLQPLAEGRYPILLTSVNLPRFFKEALEERLIESLAAEITANKDECEKTRTDQFPRESWKAGQMGHRVGKIALQIEVDYR
jgi:hypothetical protein